MSDQIKSKLVPLTNRLDGLVIDQIQKYNKIYDKACIFNNNFNKLWILTPKLKIISITTRISDRFNYSLPVRLLVEDIKLLRFLKRLEKKISTELLPGKEMVPSYIKDSNNIWKVNMPYNTNNEFTFQAYNQYNNRIAIEDITNGNAIMYVELSDIYIKGNTYGCNWSILQMKVYRDFDFSKCLFDSDGVEEVFEPPKECYHCMFCPNHHTRTAMRDYKIYCTQTPPPLPLPPPPPPPPPKKTNNTPILASFAPTAQDLAKIKLKPVIKNYSSDKNKYIEKIVDIKNHLKPTITVIKSTLYNDTEK